MKKVALFVVFAYAVQFVGMTWPVIAAALYPEVGWRQGWEVFGEWIYWIFIAVLLLCQAGLLLVPVKVDGGRSVSRRHVLVPTLVSGLLFGALCFGAILSLLEFVKQKDALASEWSLWSVLAFAVVVWAAWSVVFHRLSRRNEPRTLIAKQCRRLLQGSLLTLLVAVPTHIVARHRDYCCAGFLTFVGIVFGLAVMLTSFGPAVFFLYAERWRKLHPKNSADEQGPECR